MSEAARRNEWAMVQPIREPQMAPQMDQHAAQPAASVRSAQRQTTLSRRLTEGDRHSLNQPAAAG